MTKDETPLWALTEDEYVERMFADLVRRAESNAEGWARELAQTNRRRAMTRRKRMAEFNAQYWALRRDGLKKSGLPPEEEAEIRKQYEKLVRKAISTGEAVPEKISSSRPYFVDALEARRRYEKGRRTSFGNRTEAIDETLRATRGIKVKRQDGKPIDSLLIQEIATIIDEVEEVTGSLANELRHTDVTIAHTNGKRPFMSKAGGLWITGEGTISIGVGLKSGARVRAGAHELGHWLDFSSGIATDIETPIYTKSNERQMSRSVAEADALGHRGFDREGRDLLRTARSTMQSTSMVMRALRARGDVRTEELARLQVVLGAYWNQPREIFARLFEQYIATKRGQGGEGTETPEWYEMTPGWWSKEDFREMMPAIQGQIDRRIGMIRSLIPEVVEEVPVETPLSVDEVSVEPEQPIDVSPEPTNNQKRMDRYVQELEAETPVEPVSQDNKGPAQMDLFRGLAR